MAQYKGFISYAHADNEDIEVANIFIKRFRKFAENQMIDSWYDEYLPIGEDWFDNIQNAINECDFGLFLVSEDFISSSFIKQHEFDVLTRLMAEKGTKIIPILLKHTNFESKKITTDWQELLKKQIYMFENSDYNDICMIQNNGSYIHDTKADKHFSDLVNKIKSQLSYTNHSEMIYENSNYLNFLVDRSQVREDINSFFTNSDKIQLIGYCEKNDISDDILSWIRKYSISIDYEYLELYINSKSSDDLITTFNDAIEEYNYTFNNDIFSNFDKQHNLNKKIGIIDSIKKLFLSKKEIFDQTNIDTILDSFINELELVEKRLLIIINIDDNKMFRSIKKLLRIKNSNIKFIFLSSNNQIKPKLNQSEPIYLNKITPKDIRDYLENETDIEEYKIANVMEQLQGNITHNEIKKIMMETLNLTSSPNKGI